MNFRIDTRLTRSQANQRLKSFFNSRKRFDFAAKKPYEITGTIKNYSFRFLVRNNSSTRYAFRPNMYGEITESPFGSTINAQFKMNKIEKLILLIWTIPFLAVGLYSTWKAWPRLLTGEFLTLDYYGLGIPLLVLFLTYTWVIGSQLLIRDQRKLKNFLQMAFKDTIID